jgi:hypothetical protein
MFGIKELTDFFVVAVTILSKQPPSLPAIQHTFSVMTHQNRPTHNSQCNMYTVEDAPEAPEGKARRDEEVIEFQNGISVADRRRLGDLSRNFMGDRLHFLKSPGGPSRPSL